MTAIAESFPSLPAGPKAGAPRIMPIPKLAVGGRWRVEAMRSLSEPLFLWFTKGQGRITIAGSTRGYTANNAILIPAGVMHGFEVGPQVFGTAVFFGRGSGIPLSAAPLHLRIRETHVAQDLNVLLDAIGREMASQSPGSARAAGHYLGLLGVWIERQADKIAADTPKPDAARRLVARYAALLERDFRSGLGVGDFAEALGVTATHLTRCCRQACGRPASDLLHDRLIFEARRMLAETDLPVKDIAQMLGFTSPAYFTRAFHHRTGKAPTVFRRSA
ncbi:MAG: helix-turn-helix domain-containing protein [Paracoccaceae bacterium]|nr:MAG: helix-turn-helix domain-containing protein [Paracoccaceae bacterium]